MSGPRLTLLPLWHNHLVSSSSLRSPIWCPRCTFCLFPSNSRTSIATLCPPQSSFKTTHSSNYHSSQTWRSQSWTRTSRNLKTWWEGTQRESASSWILSPFWKHNAFLIKREWVKYRRRCKIRSQSRSNSIVHPKRVKVWGRKRKAGRRRQRLEKVWINQCRHGLRRGDVVNEQRIDTHIQGAKGKHAPR